MTLSFVCVVLLSPALDAAWTSAESAVERRDEAMRAAADAALAAVAEPPELAARAAYKRGWLAQSFARPVEARAHFERCVALDTSGRFAARARARLRALDAVPADDAVVLAAFEALKGRRDVARAKGLLADARRPETKAAITEWLASEALARGETGRARALFLAALRLDPSRRGAARGAVAAADDLAALAEVEAALIAARVPRLADEARDLRLRVYAWWGAAASLLLLLALFLRGRAWRAFRADALRRWRPWQPVAFILYAFGGGGLLAEAFDGGWLLPFLASGVATALVHLLAAAPRWSGAERRLPERLTASVAAAAATFSICFAVLAVFDRQAVLGL